MDYYGNERGLTDLFYLYGEESGDSSLFENLKVETLRLNYTVENNSDEYEPDSSLL